MKIYTKEIKISPQIIIIIYQVVRGAMKEKRWGREENDGREAWEHESGIHK